MCPASPQGSTGPSEPPAEYIEQLEEWLQSNDFSDSTIELYRYAAQLWMEHARPWEDGWRVRSMDWRKSITDKAQKTQAVYCSGAKSFAAHLIDKRLIEGQNPFHSVRIRGLTDSVNRRALTDDEVRALLRSCDLQTDIGLRDHALLVTLLHTALRIRAVAGFLLEDIEKQGNLWIVRYQGKGQRSKARSKVLPDAVLMALKAYLKKTNRTLNDRGPVFLNGDDALAVHGIRRAVKRRLKACGIQDSAVTVHSFRHTAATKALDGGADIKAVQQLLDHSSVATTDRYIHTIRNDERAAEFHIDYGTEDEDDERERKAKRKRKGKKPRGEAD